MRTEKPSSRREKQPFSFFLVLMAFFMVLTYRIMIRWVRYDHDTMGTNDISFSVSPSPGRGTSFHHTQHHSSFAVEKINHVSHQ